MLGRTTSPDGRADRPRYAAKADAEPAAQRFARVADVAYRIGTPRPRRAASRVLALGLGICRGRKYQSVCRPHGRAIASFGSLLRRIPGKLLVVWDGSETVRKAPIGPELRLRTRRNGSKKPYFEALRAQNGGSAGYSRPFSDSFSYQVRLNSLGSHAASGQVRFEL